MVVKSEKEIKEKLTDTQTYLENDQIMQEVSFHQGMIRALKWVLEE